MQTAGRNEKPRIVANSLAIPLNLLRFPDMTATGHYQIHTEARGPHWVSWITRAGETKPEGSVILVAASKEEAEARARQWAEQH